MKSDLHPRSAQWCKSARKDSNGIIVSVELSTTTKRNVGKWIRQETERTSTRTQTGCDSDVPLFVERPICSQKNWIERHEWWNGNDGDDVVLLDLVSLSRIIGCEQDWLRLWWCLLFDSMDGHDVNGVVLFLYNGCDTCWLEEEMTLVGDEDDGKGTVVWFFVSPEKGDKYDENDNSAIVLTFQV